jgi:hypothetical protein
MPSPLIRSPLSLLVSAALASTALCLFTWIDAPVPSQHYPQAVDQKVLLEEMEQYRRERDEALQNGDQARADEMSARLKEAWAKMQQQPEH